MNVNNCFGISNIDGKSFNLFTSQADQETMHQMDFLVLEAHPDLKESLANPDLRESPEHPHRVSLSLLERLENPEILVRIISQFLITHGFGLYADNASENIKNIFFLFQDHPDLLAPLVHLEMMDLLDLLVPKVPLDPTEHPELMERPVLLDPQDRPEPKARKASVPSTARLTAEFSSKTEPGVRDEHNEIFTDFYKNLAELTALYWRVSLILLTSLYNPCP